MEHDVVCIRRRRYTFWNHPVLLQDWDERQSERRPAWIELFYDLVYVAAAIQLGLFLKEDRTFAAVALFCSLVVILWFTWFQLNIYMSRFYSDSVVFKLFILFYMFGTILITLNVLEPRLKSSVRGIAAGVMVTRFTLFGIYTAVYAKVPRARAVTRYFLSGFAAAIICACVTLIVSRFVSDDDTGHAVLYILLVGGIVMEALLFMRTSFFGKHKRLPMHVEYLAERLGLFMMIMLGESIISIIVALPAYSTWWHYCSIGLCLVVIYNIHVTYFDAQPLEAEDHALRQSLVAGRVFIYSHLGLMGSLIAFGTGIKVLVGDIDTEFADSEHRLVSSTALLVGVSLASSELFVLLVRVSHRDKVNRYALPLVLRVLFCLLLAVLPAIGVVQNLPPMLFLLVVTCVSALLVVLDYVHYHLYDARDKELAQFKKKQSHARLPDIPTSLTLPAIAESSRRTLSRIPSRRILSRVPSQMRVSNPMQVEAGILTEPMNLLKIPGFRKPERLVKEGRSIYFEQFHHVRRRKNHESNTGLVDSGMRRRLRRRNKSMPEEMNPDTADFSWTRATAISVVPDHVDFDAEVPSNQRNSLPATIEELHIENVVQVESPANTSGTASPATSGGAAETVSGYESDFV